MKKIKIFIASSIKEFQFDRIEIGNFFRKLNDCYLDDGLYFQLIMCEDLDDSVSLEGKQEEYNREIMDSDLSFFLFFTKTGRHTLEEFDIALDAFRKNAKPRITTYFKTVDPDARTDEINRFIERLSKELGHYYKTYEHVDSLKLGMIMQIKLLGLDEVDVKLEGGKVTDGGEELLSLDNVEMVTGYDDLNKLKAELNGLESRFLEAKATYLENPDDNAAYEAFFELSNKRNAAKKSLSDMETALYSLIENMFEQTAIGNLSKKQVEAYRLMERGKFKEAKQILDFDEIVSDSRRDEALLDQAVQRAQVHVNEQLQLAEINKTLLDWEAADACYKEAIHLEERFNLPKKAMAEYIDFLFYQYRFTECSKVAEKLVYYWQNPEAGVTDRQKEELYIMLSGSYMQTQCFTQSEESVKAAIEINKNSTETDIDVREIGLMRCYNRLGQIYASTRQYAQAEEMLLKAVEIAERYIDSDSSDIGKPIAYLYGDLSFLYCNMGRFAETEKALSTAIELLKKERSRAPDTLHSNMDANIVREYVVLGATYFLTGRYKEAESVFMTALDIAKELVEQNPIAYEYEMALCIEGLGDVYSAADEAIKAEETFSSAVDIVKRLYDREPAVYEGSLALKSMKLGSAYSNNQKLPEAESTLNASMEIFKKLSAANPDLYVHEIAANHYLLAKVYKHTGDTQKAKEACDTALAMFDSCGTTNTNYAGYVVSACKLKEELDNT